VSGSRWQSAAVSVVYVFAALDWVGWATGHEVLTRVYPTWPQMVPWTSLFLAALGTAILLQSGKPSRRRVRMGRTVATMVVVLTVLVVAEYAAGRGLGIDRVWFRNAVGAAQATWPGRPSPQTALSAGLLAAAILLSRNHRRGVRWLWSLTWTIAMTAPAITVIAYAFGASHLVGVTPSTGMALVTALCLLLLGMATVLICPEYEPAASLLSRPDLGTLVRLASVVAGFPILLGLVRWAFVGLGATDESALTLSVALCTGLLGLATMFVSQRESIQRARLRTAAEAMLDPQVLLEAARDSSGQVVDFVYREVNRATCDYLGMAREDLLGRGVVETMPGLKGALLADYIRCLETGEPLILNDFSYDNEILADTRRYDLRVTRASRSAITLTWRDITDRFQATQELARSRDLLRASADAMFNPQALVEMVTTPDGEADLVLRDVNRAFCEYISQDRTALLDRSLLGLFPGIAGAGLMERYVECAETGVPVVLDDIEYFTEFINQPRRFDIRAAQVDISLISLTIRDTTARFETARRVAESERRFRLLVESSSVATFLARPDGSCLMVNPAMSAFTGYGTDQLLGMNWSELTAPDDIAKGAQAVAEMAAGRSDSYRITKRYVHADGHLLWGELALSAVRDEDGELEAVLAQIVDISEQMELRAAQQRNQELHRRSMESAAVGMCLARPEGAFLEVNEALCEFFGYDAETLLTKTWIELTAPDYLQADLDKVADLVAGRIDSYRMVKQFLHADGHRIWGDLTVGCLRADDGSIEVTIGQIADITERIEAEQRIAQSEERYRLLAANTDDVVIHGHNGKFVWVSPSIENLLGAPPQHWVGRELSEILPPEDRAAFAERLTLLEAGSTIQRRGQVVSVDGTTHWVHIHASPFCDADGQMNGFISALRVIDEEVAAETAAEEARVQQARADALYRRTIDNSAVGMCLIAPDGRFMEVNDALCRFFGYDADTLQAKTWQQLTAPDYLESDLHKVNDVLGGRLESYRMLKQYINADGQYIWGDLSVSCIRDEHGGVEFFISQITDVTARVEADEWNRHLAQELQRQNTVIADSEEKYRLLAENTGDVVTHVRDGIVVWASPSVRHVLGAPAEYWVGREVQEVVPPEDRPGFANRLAALARGESVMQRVRVVSRDGVTHWMHLHSRPFYDADGRWDGFIGSLRVIDEEVAAETAAEQARVQQARADALYRRSVESAAIGMCLARPEGPLLEVNEALCEFFGLDTETLLQKTWMELTAPEYLQADLQNVADLEAGRSDSYRMVKQYVHSDGHKLWGDLSVGCIRRADGSVEVLIKQITDITAQVAAEQQLERLARVDTLTGLANRGEVIARMESALEVTEGSQSYLGVLFCDVDGFKGINDKLGHAAGDTVLSTLASRIRHCVRDGDTVGRMGGDEILVLMPGMPSIDQVTRVAEKIRRHAADPLRVAGQSITVTLSIGAVLATSGQTTSAVLARADSAMYAAKTRRNAVRTFPGD